MLAEVGLPYAYEHVSVVRAENCRPEFVALNPNGKVPVIVDDDGPSSEPHVVFESVAILVYLAEKCGALIPTDTKKRSEMLQWLLVQAAYFGPMYGQARHFLALAPKEGNEYARERYTSEAYRLLDVLEARLSQSPYVGYDEFSIADIAMYPGLEYHVQNTVNLGDRPNTDRWMKAMAQRPGWQAAKATLEEILAIDLEKSKGVTAEQMDRVFGRGRFARTC